MRQVPDVAIHAVRLVFLGNGDAMLLRVFDFLRARAKFPFAPWGDDREVRRESLDRQLETHLIVALARRAVRDGVRALRFRNLNETLGNQGTRERRAQKVLALVYRLRLERRPDVVFEKFLREVFDVCLRRAGLQRLVVHGSDFVALPDVDARCDDLAAVIVLLEPRNDDGCVQTARICEYDFLHFCLCHEKQLLKIFYIKEALINSASP